MYRISIANRQKDRYTENRLQLDRTETELPYVTLSAVPRPPRLILELTDTTQPMTVSPVIKTVRQIVYLQRRCWDCHATARRRQESGCLLQFSQPGSHNGGEPIKYILDFG